MADPIKTAKNMFAQFLSKHDPGHSTACISDVAEPPDRVALAAKGGRATADSLTPRRRRQIAKRAARARWSKL